MNSPRFAPAGLLIEQSDVRIMLDGGPGALPEGNLTAWLVTDEHGELMSRIRKLARVREVEARVAAFRSPSLRVEPHSVVHTAHSAFGYLIRAARKRVIWAPEFFKFPVWAKNADLMFAEAAGWDRPIRFAGGVGGHCPVLEVARQALAFGVRRLVFAHIGRPTIRAMDAGKAPPFGEFGMEGKRYGLNGDKEANHER